MITEDFCSYEVAKLLKEKGFDWEVRAYYQFDSESKEWDFGLDDREDSPSLWGDYYVSAPTHQMARRWFREIHNVFIEVCLCWSENPREFPPQYYALILDTKTGNSLVKISDCKDGMNPIADKSAFPKYFAKYDEAMEKALKYSLEKLI